MNAGAPQRINSADFLKTVENFHQRISRKDQLTPQEISDFHRLITQTDTVAKQLRSPSATKVPNAQQVLKALETLRNTIGQNKASIVSAAQGIPIFSAVDTACNQMAKYVREEEEEVRKVGRKEGADRAK